MRELTLAKGFAATTVDEVCDEAEVSKGAFYHHFDSKGAMGIAALDQYFADLVAAIDDADVAAVEDPVERLRLFVAHVAAVCGGPVLRQGCLLGVFALEVAGRDAEIRAAIAERFDRLAAGATQLIAEAAAARHVSVDAPALSNHLLMVVEGAIVLSKAHGDPDLVERHVRMFGDHLQLVLDQGASE
jgi:TetR/AcrR family transcriptional regulator, transcriptional repressor for nem operon